MGYGLSLNRYGEELKKAQGLVISDEVESRWAWGLGVIGDTCFRLKQNRIGWFCVPQNFLVQGNGHPGNLFSQLAPGTPVKLKGYVGKVAELTVYPDDPEKKKPLVVYGYAIGKLQEEVREGASGWGAFFFGLAFLPLLWAFRRFAWPRIRPARFKP
jgi:hypothetical protein